MKKTLLLTLCLIMSVYHSLHAQTLRWGKSGGGNANAQFYGPYDNANDIATDKWGNVYLLASAFGSQVYLGGQVNNGNGLGDICIVSYTCDGTYRWRKIIGAGNNDIGRAIKTDTLGGVYVTGYVTGVQNYGHVHVDVDTTLAYTSKSLFVMKYDTGGSYRWFHMPQADNVADSAITYTRALDMDVDDAGNIFLFCRLCTGTYEGGSYIVNNINQLHILKYNANGTFLSGLPLSITFNIYSVIAGNDIYMKRDHQRNRYYICGNYPPYLHDTLRFGSTLIDHPTYIGSFSGAGSLIWARQNNDTESGGFFARPVLDDSGNIYVAGATSNGDTFNSYAFTDLQIPSFYSFPFAVKLDTGGNNVWVVRGRSINSGNSGSSIAYTGGVVGLWGYYTGDMKLGSLEISNPVNNGYRPFVATINAHTGTVTGLDTMRGDPGNNIFPSVIASDRLGNFYAGGSFANILYVASDTLTNSGGEQDFFIARYGYDNCACTAAPTAAFTFTGTHTVDFTFTGTTPADSIVWTFGDGTTGAGASPVHTYSTGGSHTVCVTVYSTCGSNTSCQSVTTTAVNTIAMESVSIYPNPLSGTLTIAHAAMGTTVKLLNVVGQQVFSGIISSDNQVIDTRSLPSGSYILLLTDNDGNRKNLEVVKE